MNGKRLLTLTGDGNFVIKKREFSPEQMFRYDASSRTIRTFSNQQRSVEVEASGRARNLRAGKTTGGWNQQFTIDGAFLKNERGLVIDVAGSGDRDGQNVLVWKKHGGKNQQWNIEYADVDKIQNGLIPDKPFRLISKMRGQRALTMQGRNVVIRDRNNGAQNQIFVYDSQTGSIQPRTNRNISVDIGDHGRGRYTKMSNERDIWTQHFQFRGDRLVNERGLVLDIAGGRDRNG
jgi:hypothetical protein